MSSDEPFMVNGENAATINEQMSCLILVQKVWSLV